MNDNNKLENILNNLDTEIENAINQTIEETLQSATKQRETVIITQSATSTSAIVRRPSIPTKKEVGDFDGRYDCFKKIIEKVNYGTNNSADYVRGHSEALQKYFDQAQNTTNNLTVVEGRVKEEVNKYSNIRKTNAYLKGYYDGLLYVYRALRNSREYMAERINDRLQVGLS